jgi:Integrase core domain
MQNLPVRIGAVPALYGWPVLPRHRLSTVTRLTTIARRIRSARPNAGGYVDDRLCRPAAPPPLPEPARKAGKCSPSPTSPPAPQPQCALIMMIQEVVAPLDRWPERDRTPSVNPQASGRKPARPYHVRGLSRSAARFARILTAIHTWESAGLKCLALLDYLKAYDSVGEARASIGRYLDFFNRKRPHSSLDARTPDRAYLDHLPQVAAA